MAETHLMCKICEGVLKVPKVLPCGHTFCCTCLVQVSEAKRVCCPECKQETQLPETGVQGLKTDVILMNEIDKYKCRECRKLASNLKPCGSCRVLVCVDCEFLHDKGGQYCDTMAILRKIDGQEVKELMKGNIKEKIQTWTEVEEASETLRKEVNNAVMKAINSLDKSRADNVDNLEMIEQEARSRKHKLEDCLNATHFTNKVRAMMKQDLKDADLDKIKRESMELGETINHLTDHLFIPRPDLKKSHLFMKKVDKCVKFIEDGTDLQNTPDTSAKSTPTVGIPARPVDAIITKTSHIFLGALLFLILGMLIAKIGEDGPDQRTPYYMKQVRRRIAGTEGKGTVFRAINELIIGPNGRYYLSELVNITGRFEVQVRVLDDDFTTVQEIPTGIQVQAQLPYISVKPNGQILGTISTDAQKPDYMFTLTPKGEMIDKKEVSMWIQGILYHKKEIYLATKTSKSARIAVLDETSTTVKRSLGEGVLSYPWYLALDSRENIIVADAGTNRTHIFDRTFGKELARIETAGPYGKFTPRGIVVDKDGYILINDQMNKAVHVFSPQGDYRMSVQDRKFNIPIYKGLALTPRGELAVVDDARKEIIIYD